MYVIKATVKCKVGIHARPASILVKTGDQFQSKIELEYKGKTVGTNSIIRLLGLGVKCNDEIIVRADGEDEMEAAAAVIKILEQSEI